MSKATKIVRVDLGVDKGPASDGRIKRGEVVGTMATKTLLYKTDPTFKALVDNLIQAGIDLSNAESKVVQLLAEIATARSDRDERSGAFDRAFNVCAANVEIHCATPAEAQGYGFPVLQKKTPSLDSPTDLQVKYDIAAALIRVHVFFASGRNHKCVLEIGSDPQDPATFKRLDGSGAVRDLSGYAPGTWWIRAATLLSKSHSDWIGPVAVVVK